MRFTKAHGTGNDFVVLADLDGTIDLTPALVRALCDRRTGVGADGVLRITGTDAGGAVFMDYRNADGSVVEMCGNGVRVVAKHVVDHDLAAPDADGRLVVDTRAGARPVAVHRGAGGAVERVTVWMGAPAVSATAVALDVSDPAGGRHTLEVEHDGRRHALDVVTVSMGNPHVVTLVDDVAVAPVTTLGPVVETDPRFGEGTNVEFLEVTAPDHARLRVWERGVGETMSCGTGACAALVAAQRLGRLGTAASIDVPGGRLELVHDPDADPQVRMTGPAVEVAHGELDRAWLAAVRA
ncbi:MAG: diaminopimelate epimerase [Actinomycetes bacterium]